MNNYHIDGVSGTGKSTVSEELRRRGYNAIDSDGDLAYNGNPITGEPAERSPLNWIWHREKTHKLLGEKKEAPLFICGDAMNHKEFSHHFAKTFTLCIDDETLKHRLATRTNNDFGKHPDELALQLEWNQGAIKNAKEKGSILIDATKPVSKVVDEILTYCSD